MAVVEFMPDWIYTFMIIPIVVMALKHFALERKVTKLATTQLFYVQQVEKICNDLKDIKFMMGRVDEHLRK